MTAPKKIYLRHRSLRGLTRKAYNRAWARLARKSKMRLGLTCRGTPRIRRRWPAGTSHKVKHAFHQQQRCRRFYERGLTGRGKPRKNSIYPEVKHLHGHARLRARYRIWYQRRAMKQGRKAVGTLLKGAPITAKLRRAA